MFEEVGYLFYLVNPWKHIYPSAEDVPAYITQAIPYFVAIFVLEQLIRLWRGLGIFKVNDAITSSAQGILMEQSKLLFPTFNIFFYSWIYDNYRLVDLPFDSVYSWILSLVLIDFGFYWFHRACHEVNFLWATHQVHHSSEHFNLTTALRQSVPQVYFHAVFYLPLALILPPSLYLVHFEFNTLFQFWIHTEIINNVGFLGYVINTPSHHRVHHGRNRYCIDKNYASVLIIWDRMFGTFAAEDDKVHYGLTTPVRTFDPTSLQMGHYRDLIKRLISVKGWRNKLSVLLKGPGWDEGKPRLGLIEDIPDITGNSIIQPYNPPLSLRRQLYLVIHFFIVLYFHVLMTERTKNTSSGVTLLLFSFIYLSFTSFASLMEERHDKVERGRKWEEKDGNNYISSQYSTDRMEFFRCLFFVFIEHLLVPVVPSSSLSLSLASSSFSTIISSVIIPVVIRIVYFVSLLVWTIRILTRVTFLLRLTKHVQKHFE